MGIDEKEPEMKKKHKFPLWLPIVIVAVVIIAIVCGVVVYSNSPAERSKRQLSLGERYLAELNYEEAVAAFKKAIEIDPMNERAKERLVEAYRGWSADLANKSDYENAIALIEDARLYSPDDENLIDTEVGLYLEWSDTLVKSEKNEYAFDVLQGAYDRLNKKQLVDRKSEIRQVIERKEAEKKEQVRLQEEEKRKHDSIMAAVDDLIVLMDKLMPSIEFDVFGKKVYEWDYYSMSDYIINSSEYVYSDSTYGDDFYDYYDRYNSVTDFDDCSIDDHVISLHGDESKFDIHFKKTIPKDPSKTPEAYYTEIQGHNGIPAMGNIYEELCLSVNDLLTDNIMKVIRDHELFIKVNGELERIDGRYIDIPTYGSDSDIRNIVIYTKDLTVNFRFSNNGYLNYIDIHKKR